MSMNWFSDEFGFAEPRPYSAAASAFTYDDATTTLKANGTSKEFHIGSFTTPSVEALRAELKDWMVGGAGAGAGAGAGTDAGGNFYDGYGGGAGGSTGDGGGLLFENVVGDARSLTMVRDGTLSRRNLM